MAIVSAAFLRRLARFETLVLIAAIFGCAFGGAHAQVSVMAGTVLNMPQIDLGSNAQIYRIVVAKNGSVLFLDTVDGALYQLAPGATSITTVSAPGAVLVGGGSDWNTGMALDANDTLYIGTEWAQPYFYRVPYNAAAGTWQLTGSSGWTAGSAVVAGIGTREIAFTDSGDMVISTQSPGNIMEFSISADGTKVGAPGTSGASGSPVTLVKSLKSEADKIAVDHAGNIYFIEGVWSTSKSSVAQGVWMIPASAVASGNPIVGEVSPLVRIDPSSAGYYFKGITVDAAGNLYLSSQVGYGGTESGVLMIPNEGTPKAPSFSPTWTDAVVVSPISAASAVAIDPRGFMWIPTFTNSGVTSLGSSQSGAPVIPYTGNWAAYALGTANLGSSPVGTAGTGGIIYYTFGASATPGKFVLSQPGSGSDFSVVTTNPLMNPAAGSTPASVDTTVVPCTAGKTYKLWDACPFWVAVNPRVVGAVSGQLQMLDASNNVMSDGTVSLYGVGQGPEVSFLGSSASSTIVSNNIDSPGMGQLAVDSVGNIYSLGNSSGSSGFNVEERPAGSTSATAGTIVYQSSTQPTGVAVDGFGNLYVGDSGKVVEVPYVSGALDMAAEATLLTGLGNHLNLAANGAGDLYVADADKAQILKVSNPALRSTLFADAVLTVGSGFTTPSALAVDGAGDLFIADGENLIEITPEGDQTTITEGLAGGVTGLAVDASGSVYVAQAGGLIWIPAEATATSNVGALNINHAVPLPFASGYTPVGVALDRPGDVYVSASGSQPSVVELSVNGSYDFGQVIPAIETDEDVQVFNIGNLPLTLSAPASDSSTLGDFYAETDVAGNTPVCGTSTASPGGVPCFLGVGVTPAVGFTGNENATLTIKSNASDATLAVSANAVNDARNATTTVISPITGLSYPGNPTITVTVSSSAGTPTGNVLLTLTGHGTTTLTLNNGVATYSPAALGGGSYTVKAVYQGDGVAGTAPDFAVSTDKITFNVGLATPVLAVPAPATYIAYHDISTITANISSAVGTPTGTVTFMNGASLADPNQGSIAVDGLGNAAFNTSGLACTASTGAPDYGVRDCTFTLTAVYSGDQNYSSATFTIGTFQIIDPAAQITATPASLTLTPGTPGTVTLNIEGLARYGDVNKTSLLPVCVSGLPQYAECTFDKPRST
jgi:hypothetical protein